MPNERKKTVIIRRLKIKQFRGIEDLNWSPSPGMNIILGGGDVGKTTILEAIGILFSPATTLSVAETDYRNRKTMDGFSIEAIISVPDALHFASGNKIYWPWEWDGNDAVLPNAVGDAPIEPQIPVYRVAATVGNDFDISWEIIQPDDTREYFSTSLRRSLGVIRLCGDGEPPRGKPRGINLIQAALAPCLPVPVFVCTSESQTH